MNLSGGSLAALAAVIREGSFERAAAVLAVTPSAVSQRIKQLEQQVGAILVIRSSPCEATPVGEAVYRHALQVEMLERDLLATVAPDAASDAPVHLAIAVNADSLATWLMPALKSFAAQTATRVDIVLDDEEHTTKWLRSGRVLGAITSQRRVVQGCRVRPLGVMRYLANASPRFVRRWLADGPTPEALCAAPSLAYNRKDSACEQFLTDELGHTAPRLSPHYLPSPRAYLEACRGGLGWGMNPEPLAAPLLRQERLVDLAPGRWVDVPLFWQQWALSSPRVDRLASALSEQAGIALRSG